MKKDYATKLKDPRWQKKRLQIMERDNWTCRYCGDEKSTLNIHHLEYFGNPWEADDDKLVTVCEHCHLVLEFYKKNISHRRPIKIKKKPWSNEGDFLLSIIEVESFTFGSILDNEFIYHLAFFKDAFDEIALFFNENS